MTTLGSHTPLRTLLLVDGATCTGMGVVLTLGSTLVGRIMDIPPALLFYAGASLFPIAAFMAIVAMRDRIHPGAAWLVVIGNAGWVAGSVLLLMAGWIAPNLLGVGFVLVQALVVALLTVLEHGALRSGTVEA